MWQSLLINLALKRLGVEPEKVVEKIVARVYQQVETQGVELSEAMAQLAREQSRVQRSAQALRRAYDAMGAQVETTGIR